MKLPKPQNTTLLLVIVSLVAGITVYLSTDALFSQKFRISSKIAPTPTSAPTPAPKSPPTAINIPKISKNLTIKPAQVNGNTWDMFPDAVAWLSTSAVPGEGNVILYAHDWTSLWADLYLLKPGDPIEIMENSIWKHYVVSESRAVMANDVHAILSDKNQLTLYTCEGSFDQKRRVVYAKPVD